MNVDMELCELKINYQKKTHDELDSQDLDLLKKATEAARKAYAPYSHFRVGAALLLENGEVFSGSNQENAAYPSGLCAERVTMFYANAQYPDVVVKTLVITVLDDNDCYRDRPIPPCGACRQSLLETETRQNKAVRVLLVGKEEVLEFSSITDLLPFTFTGTDLL